MSEAIIDVGAVLDRQKITGFNIGLVILAFLVMMTDGYDLGAAAFAGPGLIKEWGLRGPELGVLLSSSLAAGFFGPPLLGYLADRFGRKRVIVCGAYAFGLFTLSAVATSSLNQLVLTRILTGIALAGTLPIMVALINEFAPKRSRATMVVLMFTGVTFGGGLPGLIAAKFMAAHGWRILFWVGGIAPLVIATVLLVALPESVKYLTLHPARRDELIALLKRIDPSLPIGAGTRFVISSEQNKARFSFGALLAGPLAVLTPLYWVSNLTALMVFYFINQWMPTVLSHSGVTHRAGRDRHHAVPVRRHAGGPVVDAHSRPLRLSAGTDPVRLRHPDRDLDRHTGPVFPDTDRARCLCRLLPAWTAVRQYRDRGEHLSDLHPLVGHRLEFRNCPHRRRARAAARRQGVRRGPAGAADFCHCGGAACGWSGRGPVHSAALSCAAAAPAKRSRGCGAGGAGRSIAGLGVGLLRIDLLHIGLLGVQPITSLTFEILPVCVVS